MNLTITNLALLAIITMMMGQLHASSEMDMTSQNHLKFNSIKTVQVFEITEDALNQSQKVLVDETEYTQDDEYLNYYFPNKYGRLEPNEGGTGRVISTARDIVALGEDIYKLVIKGKPTNTTTYVPISVIPKQGGNPVDIFETENWLAPKKRTFSIVYTNYFSIDVVKFTYSVLYSYGGTYGGKGAYITGAQIVPQSVSTLFGFDFTATMKVGGIQNNGTRDNPIAGATLLLEHNISSVIKTMTSVDSFFITGKGGFKKF
ncbi:MAG TPA: hypothetical protein VNJ01_02370 [Bacteriovoracaceae bacterium]|nr:hypothetical protein [Bacteriovoracaceae bacterium]